MHVMVTFRHIDPTSGLQRHAEKKIQRIRKFLREPIEVHIILSVMKHRHVAEVLVTAAHLNLTAKEQTDDLYSAIDLSVGKLERQIEKRVAKQKDHKGANRVARRAPAKVRVEDGIHTQRVAVKPMSVDEALMQLKRSASDFLLFKNAANDCMSVIYRRKDGNYGLIEPDPS